MKWRNQSFPWFDNMLDLLGDSLATGRYSFYGGLPDGMDEIENEIVADEEEFDENLDPLLRSNTTSTAPTGPSTPLATPRPYTVDSQATQATVSAESEVSETQTQAQKRHQSSANLQVPPDKKRRKVTGAAALDGIGDGLTAMAEAVLKGSSESTVKDTVDSTIEGQAQEKMQEEGCLTEEGQLVMLEVLSTAVLARTFMTIKGEKLRRKWLKKQLEKHVLENGGELEELFIDWDETQR
jgi:hypothetical protein